MVAEAYNTYALYQSGFIIAPLVYFASVVVAAAMLPNFLELNSVLEMSLFLLAF